ncbi:hypothetical protein H0H81_006781 [Sphagnurus paluster]|uniref:Uncharacterized protein n=1 Tax=Sphagnurus paluster TaxID=117069 RepID=A0A9P7GL10_9AGAR|nr:hypothetical protein H0H81_006781 [Sphagnurus paluster]
MDLPSSRELELETLLRRRDTQLAELTDELTQLRQFLASQPGPSTTDPITLPPALVSILLPHLQAPPSAAGAATGSNTVNAALTQRARLLQDENDELYELLKQGETGKLKEEVRGLRRVVARLEGALRAPKTGDFHSTELDKSYESLMASARAASTANNSAKSYDTSRRASYHPMPSEAGNGHNKLPPTGPRAHKKPRLSDTQTASPLRGSAGLPAHKSHGHGHGHGGQGSSRGGEGRRGRGSHANVKMEVDDDQRARPPSLERERERECGGGRERDRERERDGHRSHRRNGGGRAGGGRRHDHGQAPSNDSGDRTLRQRMGL